MCRAGGLPARPACPLPGGLAVPRLPAAGEGTQARTQRQLRVPLGVGDSMVKTTKAPAGQQEPRARAPGGQWSPAPTRALRAAAPHAPDSPAHRSPHSRLPAPPPGPHRPGPAAGAFRKHLPVGIALRAPALRLLSALRPQPQATRQPRSASDPGRAAAFPRPGWGDRGDAATEGRGARGHSARQLPRVPDADQGADPGAPASQAQGRAPWGQGEPGRPP